MILEGSRDSRLQATSPQLKNPTMACVCKVVNFATAVRAREVPTSIPAPQRLLCQGTPPPVMAVEPYTKTALWPWERGW